MNININNILECITSTSFIEMFTVRFGSQLLVRLGFLKHLPKD